MCQPQHLAMIIYMNRKYFPVILLCLAPLALLLPLGPYVAGVTMFVAVVFYWLTPGITTKQVQILVVFTGLTVLLFHSFYWLFTIAVETAEIVQAGGATSWPQINGFAYFIIPAIASGIFVYATVYAYRTLKDAVDPLP